MSFNLADMQGRGRRWKPSEAISMFLGGLERPSRISIRSGEGHGRGSCRRSDLGPLFTTITADQFNRVHAGDRFFYWFRLSCSSNRQRRQWAPHAYRRKASISKLRQRCASRSHQSLVLPVLDLPVKVLSVIPRIVVAERDLRALVPHDRRRKTLADDRGVIGTDVDQERRVHQNG
jgi:hypothetical protein